MLDLGRWAALRHHFTADEHAVAGISGGRTSAMMAALLPEHVVLTFQNTGREHPRTYDFLDQLDEALGRRIVWLEFRPPRVKGTRPRDFEYAVVNYKTADRSGGPFEAFLQALADYRATKGKDPVAPWALARLCTAHVKIRVKDHYIRRELGWGDFESFIGLRADEPSRVSGLRSKSTQVENFRCPLYDAGIVKADVLEFWRAQAFDLQIEEHQGNCTGCFLKDYGDLSRVLAEPETDAQWWFDIEDKYDNFGGKNFPGYRALAAELPTRLAIEKSLRTGEEPTTTGDAHKFKLLVRQEKRRLTEGSKGFSCSCEQAEAMAADEDDTLMERA